MQESTLLSGLFLAALVLAPASARGGDEKETPSSNDRVVHARRTVINFSEIELMGEVSRPASLYVQARRKTNFNVLIRAKGHMVPELERSLDGL